MKEVFEAFPNMPINIDIKINDDQLIKKVSDLIKEYNREEYTVWGNFSDDVTKKCYKMVVNYLSSSSNKYIEFKIIFIDFNNLFHRIQM